VARGGKLARVGALGLLGVVTLSGCDLNNGFWRFGWPPGITDQSQDMRRLWTWSVIAALIVGILVWALILWPVIAHRKRGDELPRQTAYNLPLEVAYTIAPFIIIAGLFFFTVRVQDRVQARTADPDLTVQVNAFKWNWQFVYPDAKAPNGSPVNTIGTSTQPPILVLPTDQSIKFQLASADVIHSFWVPEFLFKLDVIPGNENGRNNVFDVTVRKTGAYVGRCAELCGTYHAFMNFEVRAVTPAQFQAYMSARERGLDTHDALVSIGLPGDATATHPFNLTKGYQQAPNPNGITDTSTSGTGS
jgi:cytochrome c oxidase subunit 2